MNDLSFNQLVLFCLHNFTQIKLDLSKKDKLEVMAKVFSGYFLLEDLLKKEEAKNQEFEEIAALFDSVSLITSNYIEYEDNLLEIILIEKIDKIIEILNKFWTGGDINEAYENYDEKIAI